MFKFNTAMMCESTELLPYTIHNISRDCSNDFSLRSTFPTLKHTRQVLFNCVLMSESRRMMLREANRIEKWGASQNKLTIIFSDSYACPRAFHRRVTLLSTAILSL